MDELIKKNISLGVLSEEPSSSFDYWVKGLLEKHESDYTLLDPKINPSIIASKLEIIKQIIIIRYIPRIWMDTIHSLKVSGVKIILFLDDDLLNIRPSNDLPIQYTLNLWWKIGRHKNKIYKIINELWVTNKYLAERCQIALKKNKIGIRILPFKPIIKVLNPPSIYRICYYGTSSHKLEIKWIKDLFVKIQELRDDCILDIVVNNYWRKEFKKIKRVRMLHPLNWETFLLDTGNRSIDIYLAPLFSTTFNLSRSPVKFLDAVRLKSVGIYSNCRPYSNFINNDVDGVLLPNSHDIWIRTIETLLENKEKRKEIVNASLSRAKNMIEKNDEFNIE